MRKAFFPERGYCNRRLQCYRPTQFSDAEVGSENSKFGICALSCAPLQLLTILPQLCTVWGTKLRKLFNAIVEVFYCFTVSVGFPGDAPDYNEDKRSAVAVRMHNKVVVERGNIES